ncbi:GNAT family N-acetyltransferase [Lactobacillus helveticus]|nr:GNAT family N-acetyltransferase [Lactobacillus helveticus]AFR22555.1 acetyltransferase [Lactobacillus helveticus R0052]MCJ2189738.1 GNAT family N-acetyltransferase [Lactobacillus helveticus]UOE23086.1 GNAT family N-acetyltransferase [Lactobacillus helveticus]UWE05802.1 GNAT family N-acetyltransferase [Lactobacillus helveticus]
MKAFPAWERFSMFSLLAMSLHRNVKFHAIYNEDQFCGITYYAENDKTVYLTYLAINEELRGQGYGSKILTMLEDRFLDKQIVIDIEPVTSKAKNYKQRVSRLKFYKRNGFHRTDQKLKDPDGEFEALTTGKKLDKESFIDTLRQMSFGFYQAKVEK